MNLGDSVTTWRGLSYGLYGLMLVAFATAVAIFLAAGSGSSTSAETLTLIPIPFIFGTVGLLLRIRVAENRMGWVFLLGGTLFAIYVVTYTYYFWGVVGDWPAVWPAALVSYMFYMPAMLALISLPLLLFPTGLPPSRRWRWVPWVMALFVGLNSLFLILSPQLPSDELGPRNPDEIVVGSVTIEEGLPVVTVDNPLGIEALAESGNSPLMSPFIVLMAASFLGPAASMVDRLIKSRGEERLQIKWLGLSALIAALGLGGFYVTQVLAPDSSVLAPLLAVGLIGVLGIPMAAGVAIGRYRLYEIDRLISRTISYAVIVGLLGLVFATGVVWLPTVLGLEDSPLLVASATLLVAALFNPLRTRIHRAVDRRFNRSRVKSQQVALEFAERLRQADGADEILGLWLATVSESLEPEVAGVWLTDETPPEGTTLQQSRT